MSANRLIWSNWQESDNDMADDRVPLDLEKLAIGDHDERGLCCRRCDCRHFIVVHTRPATHSTRRERQCRNCGKSAWTNATVAESGISAAAAALGP